MSPCPTGKAEKSTYAEAVFKDLRLLVMIVNHLLQENSVCQMVISVCERSRDPRNKPSPEYWKRILLASVNKA